jgi:hypothetical protein
VADRFIGFQIHLFIFHASPHALDEHVVSPGTFAVHGQADAPAEHGLGERCRGELAALDALLKVK